MKNKLIFSAFLILSGLTLARFDISRQLETAPLGDRYLVVTDSLTGEQAYQLLTDIVGGGGGGVTINDFSYDGDTIRLETNLATYYAQVSSTTFKVDSVVVVPGVASFAAGAELQLIIDAMSEALENTIQSFSIIDDSIYQITTFGLDTLRDTLKLPTAGVIYKYQSGDALIKATGLGVTYGLASNVGTVTIPNGVELEYVRINEDDGSIGGAAEFTLRVIDNNADVNQGTVVDFMPPIVQFIKRDNLDNDPPTTTFPFIYTVTEATKPQMQITTYGSNEIDITFKSVNNFSKWTIIATF